MTLRENKNINFRKLFKCIVVVMFGWVLCWQSAYADSVENGKSYIDNSDYLLNESIAPYANKGGILLSASPQLKSVAAVSTSWGKKIDYKRVGFYIGNKSLNTRQVGNVSKLEVDNALYIVINGIKVAKLTVWGSTYGGFGHPFKIVDDSKPQLTVAYDKNKFVWRKQFYLNKEKTETAYFSYTVKLIKDNLINIEWNAEVTAEQWKKYGTDFALFVNFSNFLDKKISMGEKSYSFLPTEKIEKETSVNIWQGVCDKFIFNTRNMSESFSMVFPDKSSGYIREELNNKHEATAYLRVNPSGRASRISVLLDISQVSESSISKTADTYAGIDFWDCDRLHVPDYDKIINFIQNPSFEAGLRYYTLHDTWSEYRSRTKPVFETSNTTAKFGRNSLQINAWPDDPHGGYLQTFAIPVKKNQEYTLSFYAKANKPAKLKLLCVTGIWMQFPKIKDCNVGTEWVRYEQTFTSPNRAMTILFGAKYSGKDKDGAEIYVDGVQLEKGVKASPYIDNKLFAELITSNKDNFLGEDDSADAKVRISGNPGVSGEAIFKLKDFFYSELWTTNVNFRIGTNGVAVIPLPSLNNYIKNGVYVIRADINTANGNAITDFFRVSRMKFLANKHKNKNITASNIPIRNSRGKDVMARCRQIGIGAANYYDKKNTVELLEKYGIWNTDIPMTSRAKNDAGRRIQQIRSFTDRSKIYVEDLTTITNVTPELEKKIEDAAYALAKENPWIDMWHLTGEVNGGGFSKYDTLRAGKWGEFGKMLVALYKGIKRYDSNKKVSLTGGPTNMNPQNGIRFLENVIKGVNGKVIFDNVAIHPYRQLPYDPDLDADAAKLLKMLDANGYGEVPVIWNEGIYYIWYDIPAWGLTPYKGCSADHYRAYCPSYDMGWGEHIAAAFFARSWLVALKYQDRVKEFNGWCSWMYMDAYLTPLAIQKIPNTLGNILGNASFVKDIRFAPKVRCYVFKNEYNKPVAAIWSQIKEVDFGRKSGPIASFNFNGELEYVYDLMGNKRSLGESENKSIVPLSSFPIFIVGKTGSMKEFCTAIQNGQLHGSTEAPITISGNPVNIKQADIICKNYLTRSLSGKLNIAGKENDLSLDSTETAIYPVDLLQPIKYDKINEFTLPVNLQLDNGVNIDKIIKFNAFAIHKKGDLLDWGKMLGIKLKNRTIVKFSGGTSMIAVEHKNMAGEKGDLDASFKACWSDDSLYIQFTIDDDILAFIPADKSVSGGWNFDSIQLYFDTFCDARGRDNKGFDENDYNYDIVPVSDNRAIVYRRIAPEQQIAGGLDAPRPNMIEPDVICLFRRTDTGYICEVTFPKRLLAPMEFKENAKIGLGIFINDNDGNGLKSHLTTTPAGTGCYMHPELYPVMLLTE